MQIDLHNVTFTPSGRDTEPVIDNLSMSIESGELLAVIGPSGCGKTSLLKLVGGLHSLDEGKIEFGGAGSACTPKCPMAFQDHGLFPWLSVLDNTCIGLEAAGVSRTARHAKAMKVLQRIGLDHIADKKPSELSGGMRQRVSLVRLIISDGDVLLLDEPLSALDAQTRLFLQQELLDLWSSAPRTTIYVTHDIEEALTLADRVVIMAKHGGEIIADMRVPTERPRIATARPSAEIEAMRWDIWKLLAGKDAQGQNPNSTSSAMAN